MADATPQVWIPVGHDGIAVNFSGQLPTAPLIVRHGWPDFSTLDRHGRDAAGAFWVPTVFARPNSALARRWRWLRSEQSTTVTTTADIFCGLWPEKADGTVRNRWQLWAQPPATGTVYWRPGLELLPALDRLLLVWQRRWREVGSNANLVLVILADVPAAVQGQAVTSGWQVQFVD